MPQIDNVDNICNTVIMKVVIICMKSSLKKRLITVPVSHLSHNHYFPNNCPDNDEMGCLYSLGDNKLSFFE